MAAMLASLAVAAPGVAAVPYTTISSDGPLSAIHIGNDLSCQVEHVEDDFYEFYPSWDAPGDCGTFVEANGVLYAPNFDQHDYTATQSLADYTPFTPVSQSSVLGAGTADDPYRIETVVLAGSAFEITETDSYVVGDDSYRTDVSIRNLTAEPLDLILYRAGDCFLGGSDHGYGFVADGGVGCSANPDNQPAGRIEQWVPLTPGSSYLQDGYAVVWDWIGQGVPFPNSCRCTEEIDNGAGLSWSVTLGAGESAARSHLTRFSGPVTVPSALEASAAIANVVPGTAVHLTLRATLTDATSGEPVPWRIVSFSVAGEQACIGVTNASGIASCGGPLAAVDAALAGGYRAEFAGDERFGASADDAPVLVVAGSDVP